MFEKIQTWIRNIQKNNWGLPWHIFFANILTHLIFPIFMLTRANWGRGIVWAIIATFMIVNIIGYLNEIIFKDQDKTEFWQDMIANNVGVLISVLQWFYLIKLFL